MFFENLLLALKTMKTNRLRTVLSLLGVMIGVASLVTILSIAQGARKSMTSSFTEGGVDIITLMPGRGRGAARQVFTEEFADEIKSSVSCIDYSIPMNTGNFTLRYSNQSQSASVIGTSSTFSSLYALSFSTGRWFTVEENIEARQVCVLGKSVADDLFPSGDAVGKYVKIFRNSAKSFQIIGVMESRDATASIAFDTSCFIPYNTYSQRLTNSDRVSMYILHIKEGFDPARSAEEVSTFMDSVVTSDGYSIFSAATLAEMIDSSMKTFSAFLAAVAAISLIVGGIGIMNIMLVSVTERTREIGIRKALGASASVIQHQFLLESAIMTLTGGVLGIILGSLISLVACLILKWGFSISWPSFAIGLAFSLVVGVFFGWYPSSKAAKLNPIDALSAE